MLPDGLYTIVCKASGCKVGRHLVEAKTLLPKRVMVLRPEGSLRGASEAPWLIQRTGEKDTYKMQAGGALVGALKSRLVAHLTTEEDANTWVITHRPEFGDHCFTYTRTRGLTRACRLIYPRYLGSRSLTCLRDGSRVVLRTRPR
ncbi:uncharacterized protein PHACADRAFT_150513 [Phanerochaete carnosa HHB-10118-sp]|uniref:Uncharacterized protein n=1 Tax=Phanerochaete carnosa (strain HHB-10118-sp) TaxID=650164 RepID=K5VKB8_PHACS|nr:uncharacterized protein PHACADRAFT_150513 [Phanerochaete carnosa HHB-10118-sp]EKM51803.1 hypothetical protein PHACADRAFT_150513 [Phanerochaete carnosa HHB-10118-sp]